MRKLIAAAISSIFLAGTATASDWRPLSANSEGDKFLIDLSSVRVIGDEIQVWTLTNLAVPRNGNIWSQKVAFRVRCASEEIGLKAGVAYSAPNGQGQLLNSSSTEYVQFQPAIPDSVQGVVVRFVCNGR